jgi:hypothetical protein
VRSADRAIDDRGVSVSTFRKTVLTTAIIGAGLASTAGSAFATDNCDSGSHHDSHAKSASAGCSNDVKTGNATKISGDSLANAVAPITANAPINACHILDNNSVLDGNQLNIL